MTQALMARTWAAAGQSAGNGNSQPQPSEGTAGTGSLPNIDSWSG